MFSEKFKIVCNKCGGDKCYVSPEEVFFNCSEEVTIAIICPDCKENKIERMDIMQTL